jgi:hypothetical protein
LYVTTPRRGIEDTITHNPRNFRITELPIVRSSRAALTVSGVSSSGGTHVVGARAFFFDPQYWLQLEGYSPAQAMLDTDVELRARLRRGTGLDHSPAIGGLRTPRPGIGRAGEATGHVVAAKYGGAAHIIPSAGPDMPQMVPANLYPQGPNNQTWYDALENMYWDAAIARGNWICTQIRLLYGGGTGPQRYRPVRVRIEFWEINPAGATVCHMTLMHDNN